MTKKSLLRTVSALILTFLVLFLFACNSKDSLKSSSKETEAVMTVGGYAVPMEIYRYVALNSIRGFDDDYDDKLLTESINATIINMYTTVALCGEYGISITDEYISDTVDIYMDNIYEEYENDYKAYKNYLADYNMNDGVYRFVTRNEILAEELFAKMISLGEIPSDEDELRAILRGEEFVRIKQILIPADNGKTDAENLAEAERILNLAKDGEDFDTLVQKYGGDLYMFNNPDGYYLSRGRFYVEFEEAAFALEMGEISEIIKTDAGYSILKKYEKEESYIKENEAELMKAYQDGLYSLRLESFSETLSVTELDALKKYPISSLKMN